MSAVVNDSGPDAGAPLHYGDPLREQRWLEAGEASVDLGHRPVFSVAGADRLTWLHALTSQKLDDLAPGVWTTALILDPNGRIEHVFGGVDDGETFWASTEPDRLEALLGWLDRMRFASRVELADRSATHAMIVAPGEDADGAAGSAGVGPLIVERSALDAALGERRAGTWASEAVRIASGQPRIFLDTDERTIPNEIAVPVGHRLGAAVHLAKGCYRGQETVARVHTLGRPPRRLTLLHLDGSAGDLPEVGAELTLGGRVVGRVGTSAHHHELGPIALGLVKRNVPLDAALQAGPVAASQEAVVDPEVGMHVRPKLG